MDHHGPVRDQVLTLWREVGRRFGGHMAERASELDLTQQQAFALHLLSSGPMAMSLLAEKLYCDASNVTGIADRLETRGLVERLPDPRDRHVKQLSLTLPGTELMDAMLERLRENPPLIGNLTEDELRQLADLLQAMLERDDQP